MWSNNTLQGTVSEVTGQTNLSQPIMDKLPPKKKKFGLDENVLEVYADYEVIFSNLK